MREEKGKGPATDLRDASHETSQTAVEGSSQNSIFSRVKSSTAGLASSAFSAPSSDEINKRRVALLEGTRKSSRSETSNSSAWTEASRPAGGRANGPKESEPTRFRNGLEDQHMQQIESEFSLFLDGIDPFVPIQDDTPRLELSVDLFAPTQNAFLRSSMSAVQSESQHENRHSAHLTVQDQQGLDGDDVIALLCNPSFMDESLEGCDEVDSFNLHLTAEQISKITAITNSLFPLKRPHTAPAADHPLNLYPNLDMSPVKTVSLSPMGGSGGNTQAYFNLNNDSEEAKRTFIRQWDEVLTGYVDEVWGDLLPLVKEARREVETIKGDDPPPMQPKALRRLGLILSHIKK